MDSAIRESLSNAPDPLHFELPKTHKKILETLYILAIIGAIISIMLLSYVGILSVSETNASIIVVMILVVILGFYLIEKSTVSHKPKKSSS